MPVVQEQEHAYEMLNGQRTELLENISGLFLERGFIPRDFTFGPDISPAGLMLPEITYSCNDPRLQERLKNIPVLVWVDSQNPETVDTYKKLGLKEKDGPGLTRVYRFLLTDADDKTLIGLRLDDRGYKIGIGTEEFNVLGIKRALFVIIRPDSAGRKVFIASMDSVDNLELLFSPTGHLMDQTELSDMAGASATDIPSN
jgi:hypothetical protein